MVWDIFCRVIDNHGDIGVCWRLAAQLAMRGESVSLRVDDASALAWLAPQGHPRVEVKPWSAGSHGEAGAPGGVVVEAFGCELAPSFQAAMALREPQPAWLNLEYLTAESFAARNHGLSSPVLVGGAAGLTKYFFYPGFTPETGGLLREPDFARLQRDFDAHAWRHATGIHKGPGLTASLFCYEPPVLRELLLQLAQAQWPTQLVVASGRPAAAARAAIATLDERDSGWNAGGLLSMHWLPLIPQPEFDHLLWSCDLNFVRGEDSLVRALLAGKPFIWHIYPQDDNAHHAKLRAFLDWLGAPQSLRDFHFAWNGMGGALPPIALASWARCAQDARDRLLAQDDLVTRLIQFVDSHRRPA